MKKTGLLVLLALFIELQIIHAQRSDVNGGPVNIDRSNLCLSDEQRQEIRQELKKNIDSLKLLGKLPVDQHRSNTILFEFPMAWNEGFDDYGFHAITNYVDQTYSLSGLIEDYNCGQRSYDGHRGIDYYLWPFSWKLVDENAVKIVAAAPGVIIVKKDGHDHHSCATSNQQWNAVYLMHADGSITWYGHMKLNSLTDKDIGESVEAGEYLGIVASSGNSTGPHLHFETYDISGNLIDPFVGDCNATNSETWWMDQRPYYDPALNKIQTHFAPPDLGICPDVEVTNESDEFEPGQQVYFAVYLKDQQSSNLCLFSILDPFDEVFDSWTFNSPHPHLSVSYWYWSHTIPSNAPEGVWSFKCQFAGDLYTHEFTIGDVSSIHEEKQILNDLIVYAGKDEIKISTKSDISFDGEIFISDVYGRRLYHSIINFLAGKNFINIPCNNYMPGVYFVTLASEQVSFLHTRKLVFVD